MDATATRPPRSLAHAARGVRIARVLRWALALVFAWSAGAKLIEMDAFRQTLLYSGVFPRDWLTPLSRALPVGELGLSLWLAVGRARVAALLLSAFCAATFTAFHAYLLVRGDLVPCGCLLNSPLITSRPEAHWTMLAISAGMFAAAAGALLLPLSGQVHRQRNAA